MRNQSLGAAFCTVTDVTRFDGSVGIFYNPSRLFPGRCCNVLMYLEFRIWHEACIC
jgi:hypothetical protein